MNIALLLYHEVHELDVVSAYSALRAAASSLPEDQLNLFTTAKSRNSVQTSGGLTITPQWAFMSAPEPDVLIVPGGAGVNAASRDRALTSYLKDRAERVRLLVSVSTGAFLLGELGLLRDLRATTWLPLRERLLDYDVGEVVEARVVKNKRVWCAGGASAGLDVGLELLREFYGQEVAARAAERVAYPFWQAQD